MTCRVLEASHLHRAVYAERTLMAVKSVALVTCLELVERASMMPKVSERVYAFALLVSF